MVFPYAMIPPVYRAGSPAKRMVAASVPYHASCVLSGTEARFLAKFQNVSMSAYGRNRTVCFLVLDVESRRSRKPTA
jgi:hypothetical protein